MLFRRIVFLPLTVSAFSVPTMINKPTGTSFLPKETVERAKIGSPIEKIKIEKDGSAAWTDVYEYARKIREGEMTWEEVEKADLDTVRSVVCHVVVSFLCTFPHQPVYISFSASNTSACYIAANELQDNS